MTIRRRFSISRAVCPDSSTSLPTIPISPTASSYSSSSSTSESTSASSMMKSRYLKVSACLEARNGRMLLLTRTCRSLSSCAFLGGHRSLPHLQIPPNRRLQRLQVPAMENNEAICLRHKHKYVQLTCSSSTSSSSSRRFLLPFFFCFLLRAAPSDSEPDLDRLREADLDLKIINSFSFHSRFCVNTTKYGKI